MVEGMFEIESEPESPQSHPWIDGPRTASNENTNGVNGTVLQTRDHQVLKLLALYFT